MLVQPGNRKASRQDEGVDPLIERAIELAASGALHLVAFVAFAAFFAGYAAGRRRGKREGAVEGARYAPLELRRQTWEKGYCVICGSLAESAPGTGESSEEPPEGVSSPANS